MTKGLLRVRVLLLPKVRKSRVIDILRIHLSTTGGIETFQVTISGRFEVI